jgi:hypothetical protein
VRLKDYPQQRLGVETRTLGGRSYVIGKAVITKNDDWDF